MAVDNKAKEIPMMVKTILKSKGDAVIPAFLEQGSSDQHGHAAAIFPDEL